VLGLVAPSISKAWGSDPFTNAAAAGMIFVTLGDLVPIGPSVDDERTDATRPLVISITCSAIVEGEA
jgi:hypothetical protein